MSFLTGRLCMRHPPTCLQSTTLEELYMSRTTLTGALPDSIPADSALRVWCERNPCGLLRLL
jgi:hypothetical protein